MDDAWRYLEPLIGETLADCIGHRLAGYELREMPLPSLLAISNEANEPRIAPLPGVLKAKKKDIPEWNAQDINVEMSQIGATGAKTSIRDLEIPVIESRCEFITGGDLEEAAINLVERLRTEKII